MPEIFVIVKLVIVESFDMVRRGLMLVNVSYICEFLKNLSYDFFQLSEF